MILEQLPAIFSPGNKYKSVTSLLFFFLLLSTATASYADKKSYLRLEKNDPSLLNDLKITSIGGLVFEDDMEAHIDLVHTKSEVIGDSLAVDFGGGFVFNWDVAVFLGVGVSLEYNQLTSDFNDKYYSEAGVVVVLSNRISITARKQHIYNQPDNYEEVVMFGILFRD